ncbi:hypothetical protein SAMN05414139_02913 [Burkholderia sp. D7]|nr:hypothetical protein SAMN05414139_02913 [Burkholderia sp. D7]
MDAHDEAAFANTLEICFANYFEPAPGNAVIQDWIKHLTPYSIMQVGNALEQHKRKCTVKPTLAHILALLPPDPSDWPSASVAMSEMLQAESGRFLLITKEHVAGHEAARPFLEARDKFSAGRAFADTYAALVTAAKNAGTTAAWFIADHGADPEGTFRREALREGARLGRITRDHGKKLAYQLPTPLLPSNDDAPAALLAGPSVKNEVENLRALLRPKDDATPVRDKSPENALAEQQKAEAKRKVKDFLALEARERAVAKREAAIAAWEAAHADVVIEGAA